MLASINSSFLEEAVGYLVLLRLLTKYLFTTY